MQIFQHLDGKIINSLMNKNKTYKNELYQIITTVGYEYCLRKYRFVPLSMRVLFRYSSLSIEFVSNDKRRKNNFTDIIIMPTMNGSFRTGVATVNTDSIESVFNTDFERVDTAEELEHQLAILLIIFKITFDGRSFSFRDNNKISYDNTVENLKSIVEDTLGIIALKLKNNPDIDDDIDFIHCHYNTNKNKLDIIVNERKI